jgi:hypothetical protein
LGNYPFLWVSQSSLPHASLYVLKMIKVIPQQKVPLFGHATDPDGDALDI